MKKQRRRAIGNDPKPKARKRKQHFRATAAKEPPPNNELQHFFTPGRELRPIEKAGLVIVAFFLLVGCLMVYYWLTTGRVEAYEGHYGQNTGAFLFAALCYAGAIVWMFVVWRHWVLRWIVERRKVAK